MSSTSSSSYRSSISPFGRRKSPAPPAKYDGRPLTPSSSITPSAPPLRRSKSPVSSGQSPPGQALDQPEAAKSKENVTVTVRFRPLSAREINKGDEIAWYADGDYTVRNEHNPAFAYGFDRVFGPATTTRCVYDVAAQHVVSGAMQGINGTVFAYGVTSSGKTHTMHGEQKSPGIIPLAVKDVFGIIQETPGREFLLRVSYLEIYNEVINDLLDPTGQNLKIREDAQGTYVEGIKEEVVLSPAHALSLIASGEEHRHVGSNNVNLLSSRSHTIFTLIVKLYKQTMRIIMAKFLGQTIESSPCGENEGDEDVTLSQLHLIDLAGSESSKTETTGLRRKEGSYINKSLLALGTVISKLTDEKATHIPYRDSKLTRLLQSSLSGHGRISLICTVTPASSNCEETHNTLKFAHRSKHVEIKAAQNKIMDEKSLIKKYQKEISSLKQELQQLKRGMTKNPYMFVSPQEDLVNLKLQLEAGQVKLQSRLEEEEQAKAALLGRIQRLTKLILVSTKNSMQSGLPERPGHRRRHSFGEDELAYLPDRKHDYMTEEDSGSYISELSAEKRDDATNLQNLVKDYKCNRRGGMLGWFKLKKPEGIVGPSQSADSESSVNSSPGSSSKSSQSRVAFTDMKDGKRKSNSRVEDASTIMSLFPERTQAGDLFGATGTGHQLPLTRSTIMDQMDLLHEQMKMIAGELALCTSSLKRLSEQAAGNPGDMQLKEQIQKLKDEISEKKLQMHVLERRMIGSVGMTPQATNSIDLLQAVSKLTSQLNEKTFELEIKSADNRILQEQLQMKTSGNTEMQETILLLRQQLNLLTDRSYGNQQQSADMVSTTRKTSGAGDVISLCEGTFIDGNTPKSVMSLDRIFSQEDSKECNNDTFMNSHILIQAAEIEKLKQEKSNLVEEKDGLEIHCRKLEEEASYAKELAAAAAVELQNLAEEVTRLSYDNAKLIGELAAAKEAPCQSSYQSSVSSDFRQNFSNGSQPDGRSRKQYDCVLVEELQKELDSRRQKEVALQVALSGKDKIESELRGRLDEAKRHEEALENELANMWVLVAKMKKLGNTEVMSSEGVNPSSSSQAGLRNGSLPANGHSYRISKDEIWENIDSISTFDDLKATYQEEKSRSRELESLLLRLKGEDIADLDIMALEELQNFHVEAITKICQAKVQSTLQTW